MTIDKLNTPFLNNQPTHKDTITNKENLIQRYPYLHTVDHEEEYINTDESRKLHLENVAMEYLYKFENEIDALIDIQKKITYTLDDIRELLFDDDKLNCLSIKIKKEMAKVLIKASLMDIYSTNDNMMSIYTSLLEQERQEQLNK
jgi:hypothetical protein